MQADTHRYKINKAFKKRIKLKSITEVRSPASFLFNFTQTLFAKAVGWSSFFYYQPWVWALARWPLGSYSVKSNNDFWPWDQVSLGLVMRLQLGSWSLCVHLSTDHKPPPVKQSPVYDQLLCKGSLNQRWLFRTATDKVNNKKLWW